MQRRRTITCSITARGTLHNITAACCLCCVCQCTDGSITDKPLLQLVCKFHATSEVTSSLPATGVSGVEHRLCLKASYGFGKDIRQRGTASLPPSLLYEWTDKGNAFCLQVVTVNDYLARRDSEGGPGSSLPRAASGAGSAGPGCEIPDPDLIQLPFSLLCFSTLLQQFSVPVIVHSTLLGPELSQMSIYPFHDICHGPPCFSKAST